MDRMLGEHLVRVKMHEITEGIERLVGNDTLGHVHNVAFLDRLGLGVGVERLAEKLHRGKRRRGGKGHEKLIQVVLADDPGDLLHTAALVVAGKDREGGTLGSILGGFLFGCPHEVEGNGFEQAVLGKHVNVFSGPSNILSFRYRVFPARPSAV